jgi:hypothetical protein
LQDFVFATANPFAAFIFSSPLIGSALNFCCATPLGDAVSVQRMRSQRLRNFRRFARYSDLFKPNEPVVRAVFGLSVFPFVRENERRKQGSKVYGQKDDGVGAV